MTAERDTATTADETLVFFPAGRNRLFGILTRPTAVSRSTAVIVVWGGGSLGSTGRNRIWVRLCRRLAAIGYHTFRFDFRGQAESTGHVERFRLDELFVEDVQGSIDWVKSQGIESLILVGWCFGGRTALACAPSIPGLQGLVLVSAPPRNAPPRGRAMAHMASRVSTGALLRHGWKPWVVRGLFDRNRRRRYVKFLRAKWRVATLKLRLRKRIDDSGGVVVSSSFLKPLEQVVDSRVPVLFLYGTDDPGYEDFRAALQGRLGRILEESGPLVEIAELTGGVHGIGRLELQDAVIEVIHDWISRRAPVDARVPAEPS